MSYAELDAASDRVAAGLVARGLRPGDAVVLQLPNMPQFVVAYFGILKAGCVVVPMNVLFKAGEVGYVLTDSGARMLITWSGAAEEAAKGAADAGVDEVFVLDIPGLPAAGRRSPVRAAPGDAGHRTTAPAPVRSRRHRGDRLHGGHHRPPEGRRAQPLPAVHERRHPGPAVRRAATTTSSSRCCRCSTSSACRASSTSPSGSPRRCRWCRGSTPRTCWRSIQRDRVTVFEGVPTMYIAAAQPPRARQLRRVVAARRGLRRRARSRARSSTSSSARFGIVILEGYGLSETASTTTFNVSAEERRIYSVGKPIYGVEVQVWDGGATSCRPVGSTWVNWSSAGST